MRDMSTVTPREVERHGLKIHDLEAYAMAQGWQPIPDPLGEFLLFNGPAVDEHQQPIRLALPTRDDFPVTPLRLAEAVNLLAALEQRSPAEVLKALTPTRQSRGIESFSLPH